MFICVNKSVQFKDHNYGTKKRYLGQKKQEMWLPCRNLCFSSYQIPKFSGIYQTLLDNRTLGCRKLDWTKTKRITLTFSYSLVDGK